MSLQEKSLVEVDARLGHSRQHLLETVREYARDKLRESDGAERLGDRHLAFFLQMAEDAELKFDSGERGHIAAKIDADLDNVRGSIRWSLARRPEAGLRLVGAIFPYWTRRGLIHEGHEWAEQVLAACDAQASSGVRDAPSLVRVCAEAKTLTGSGFLAFIHGDYVTAQSRLEAAQIKANASGDPRIQCNAQNYFGMLRLHQGDQLAARALHERSVVLARQMGDR